MGSDISNAGGGLFKRLRDKVAGVPQEIVDGPVEPMDKEQQMMIEEFEAVKKNPGQLSGWDFDRAFDFIERYPESSQAEILLGQMYSTTGMALKGLSYPSAVKVLERMPGHAGSEAIIRGMRKIEKDFIQELRSDIIAYMLRTIPDHPLGAELTAALATKNLTNAYEFITANPDNVYTERMITAMFARDPNVSVLLLQEKMDHPKVASIFEGIYSIKAEDVRKLTPNAIMFILEVAPDHPQVERLTAQLVESNYIKAYDFIVRQPDHILYDKIKSLIIARKPEIEKLFATA